MRELTEKECDELNTILSNCKIITFPNANLDRMIKWAETLESGKYKQTNGMLADGNKHRCCLGVACDISNTLKWTISSDYTLYGDEVYILPREVYRWMGFSNGDPIILTSKVGGDDYSFAAMNDELNLSFNQIAWIIRESVRLTKKELGHDKVR